MSNSVPFESIRLKGKPLKDCNMALECGGTDYRLYVLIGENSFYAQAVRFASCIGDKQWECEYLKVEPIFNLSALFDGVRHLEFNREAGEMAGYIYYPDIAAMIELFQKVREIELQVCRECLKD